MTAMPIRAALARAFGEPLRIETVLLDPPGPGQVAVTLRAVAVCHSDIGFVDGIWGGHLPAVYGHEAAGRVRALGAGVTGLAVGQDVIVTLIRQCGTCPACRDAAPVHCETPYDRRTGPLHLADGTVVEHGLNCGAFAEAVVVDASQVIPVPEDLPPEAACLLACGVITGVGAAVHSARVRPGETVVVIGAGGVGLNAIQGARIAGAARVIALDLSEAKRADALAFGATHALDAGDPRPWKAVQALTDGRGADAVLVCTGAIAAHQVAARLAARRGRIVAVGMPPSGATVAVEPVILAALGQSLTGSLMGDVVPHRDIPWLIDLWRQGRLQLEPLVTGRWPLEAINEAIAETRAGRARRSVIVLDQTENSQTVAGTAPSAPIAR
ncbi:MAG: zinc-binding dehydrogenase [Gemmobacter sp.]